MNGSEEITKQLASINDRLAAIEGLLTTNTSASLTNSNIASVGLSPDLSPTEYILRLKPSGDVERTLVFANFLEEHRDLPNFNSEDIGSLFVEARMKKPANVADKIGKNASKGLIMSAGEVDGKKTWKLTLSGQAYMKELENGR